jgi:hypothetical protein
MVLADGDLPGSEADGSATEGAHFGRGPAPLGPP